MVTLVDSDSFQVRSSSMVYRCRVGTGEYTPPEVQGHKLENIDRTTAHDGCSYEDCAAWFHGWRQDPPREAIIQKLIACGLVDKHPAHKGVLQNSRAA